MQRSIISNCLPISNRILNPVTRIAPPNRFEIFINHRERDTKKTIAGLLHQHLSDLGYNPFMHSLSTKPGDMLFDNIDPVIKKCRVGVAVFSPRYCESYYCMRELAQMIECKKKVVPIFWDVRPSQLKIKYNGSCSTKELERFQRAIDLARNIVGLTFDSSNGDWSEFLTRTTNAVCRSLIETEDRRDLKIRLQNIMQEQDCPNTNDNNIKLDFLYNPSEDANYSKS